MNRRMRLAIAAVGALVMLASVPLGLWWLTFPGAVAVGASVTRARTAIGTGALLGFIAWALPLQSIQLQYGLQPAADALAAIMGYKGAALIPIVLTVLVGTLLGASGAWLGSSGRTVVLSRPWSRPVQKLGDERLEVKDSVLAKS